MHIDLQAAASVTFPKILVAHKNEKRNNARHDAEKTKTDEKVKNTSWVENNLIIMKCANEKIG